MISFLFHNLEFLYSYRRGAGKVMLEESGISRASWSRYTRDRNLPAYRMLDIMNAMKIGPEVFFGSIGFRATLADIAPRKDFRKLRIDHQFMDRTMRTSRILGGPTMKEAALAVGVSEVWLPKLTREDTPIDAEQLCRFMNLYELTPDRIFVSEDDCHSEEDNSHDDSQGSEDKSVEARLDAAMKHIGNMEYRLQRLEVMISRLIAQQRKKRH